MAELTTLARPYAKAAFEFAAAGGKLQDWSKQLNLLAVLSLEDTVQQLLSSPSQTAEQKATSLIDVCSDELSKEAGNFVRNMASNNRLALLPQVSALFDIFKANQEKSVDVELTTAFELSSEQEQKLAQALQTKLERSVNLQSSVDKSLLGGVLVRAGDTVIDGSIRGRLAKLAETLAA